MSDPPANMSHTLGIDGFDWLVLTAKLPTGRDTASALQRGELFFRFDKHQHGVLTLAEVEMALRYVLGLESMYSAKPVIQRAFQAAKDVSTSKRGGKKRAHPAGLASKGARLGTPRALTVPCVLASCSRRPGMPLFCLCVLAGSADFVERDDFRLLLVYLRQYFELFVAFNRLDANYDQQFSLDEFRRACQEKALVRWGVTLAEEDVDKEFATIVSLSTSKSTGQQVLFDEFCHWAIKKHLRCVGDHEETDDIPGVDGKSAAEEAGPTRKAKAKQPHATALHMPAWRQKLIQQRAESSAMTSSIISSSTQREHLARERLVKMKAKAQRELTRAASLAALEDFRERKRVTVANMRAENDKLIGKDMNALVANVPKPSEEEIVALSKLLNDQLKSFDKNAQNFFGLFKFMDIDGSRRISFDELETMCRRVLRLREKDLPIEKLQGLWKTLDADLSGFIDAGELSRFLKLGQPKTLTPAQIARKKMLEAKAQERKALQEELDRKLAKDVAKKAKQVEPATLKDLHAFGAHFARANKGGQITNYYTLFKHMDGDQSGKVEFVEFETMVRKDLGLSDEDLTNRQLWSLWRRIDEDGSGFICAGEFGRFMRSACEHVDKSESIERNPNSEAVIKINEMKARHEIRREETWARNKANRSMAIAKELEAEAERIEKLLAGLPIPPPRRSKSSTSTTSSAAPSPYAGHHQGNGFSAELAEQQQQEEDQHASPDTPGASTVKTAASPYSKVGSPTRRIKGSSAASVRKEALDVLAREVKGDGFSQVKGLTRPKKSNYLLPTIKREEGQI